MTTPPPASPLPSEPSPRARINLMWLLRLRWGVLVGQAVLVAVAAWGLKLALPVTALVVLLAVEALTNAAVRAGLSRARPVAEAAIFGLMLWDTLVLTGLLALSGGTHNPFTTLYLVNVALGTVLLPARRTWAMLVFTLLAFGSLFVLQDVTLPGLARPDHAELMRLHLSGMWVAFAVAAGFIVYFIQRVTRALAEREQELAQTRARHARQEKVASLATLAAGAAHELSTPLSTIAVVAKELERALAASSPSESVREDLRLIRQQVDRCRDVLVQMSADAGQTTGEPFHPIPLERLVEETLSELSGRERVRVELPEALKVYRVHGPPRALARVLRGLVKNALQATPGNRPVTLSARAQGPGARLEVRDEGQGMPDAVLARAGEPFFTTKAPGEGMGLGLFLARTLAEQLGGSLELRSKPGEGTTVGLSLPAASAQEAAA
ncbi:sensor histidine kinase [Corallococcus sp. CA047B]|uniref:ATP-binding protein n=1 Tax=Corallococcus sp. CA047B TaxID=2316729 RepID=UPI000EA0DBC8|nr:ATP-binding protein [Corallococcus sp. CA047B]RKH17621.1 sensor histidine kinase [Corallococcus sp. CA047B]